MKKCFAVVSLLALAACGGAGAPSVDDIATPRNAAPITDAATLAAVEIGPDISVDDTDFAGILNNLRISRGTTPVAYDARLNEAAQKHAADMAVNNYFAHESLDGRTPLDRIRAEGYEPRTYGENIAGRQQTEEAALDAWINSPDHNALLGATNMEDFALGVAGTGSQTRWVLLMATER